MWLCFAADAELSYKMSASKLDCLLTSPQRQLARCSVGRAVVGRCAECRGLPTSDTQRFLYRH